METESTIEGSLEDLDDEALIARCQQELPHRTEGFHELLRRHEGMVYHTCLRMLGNVEEAEETCQDAFVRVFQKLHQFEGRSSFKTWLFRVVYNFCMTRRRKLATRRERRNRIQTEFVHEAESRHQASEDNELDLSENVHRAINQLKPGDREVIVLRFISDLSLEEIADVLEIGLSATKMRLYRAMERFKSVYQTLEKAS